MQLVSLFHGDTITTWSISCASQIPYQPVLPRLVEAQSVCCFLSFHGNALGKGPNRSVSGVRPSFYITSLTLLGQPFGMHSQQQKLLLPGHVSLRTFSLRTNFFQMPSLRGPQGRHCWSFPAIKASPCLISCILFHIGIYRGFGDVEIKTSELLRFIFCPAGPSKLLRLYSTQYIHFVRKMQMITTHACRCSDEQLVNYPSLVGRTVLTNKLGNPCDSTAAS